MLLCLQQFICYMDIKEMDNRTKAKRRDHSSDSNQTSWISASEPAVVATEIQATASSTLYNERQQPVTVHYRFFWYDARGLEMHPLDAPRTIVVPARSSVTLYGSANILGAHKARLYLYL